MKFSFPDKYINSASFIELCNTAQEYGFEGVEIFDAEKEKQLHTDSIFRSSITADAKRKLVNRHIEIPVLTFPSAIDQNTDPEKIIKYVEYAALASVSGVIIKFNNILAEEDLKKILIPAIAVAEKSGVSILIETCGPLNNTEKVLDILNFLSSAVMKVCWNIRETFFIAGESADKTIQTLGAYIAYVRIGDRKNDENVLIGDGDLPVKDFVRLIMTDTFALWILAK